MLTGPWLTSPGFLGLPRDIWLIAAAALLMLSGLLTQEIPALRAAVRRGRARRRRARRGRRRWDLFLTGAWGLSDDQWLAELARMRTEQSGQAAADPGPPDWDPPGDQLAAWLDTEQVWPGDPRRPPA